MSAVATYGSGTTSLAGRSARSTQAEMEARRSTLLELARDAQPASVRHLYYRAVVAGLVEKKETGYRKVQRQILELRRTGEMPFYWITDDGRRSHPALVDHSPSTALRSLAHMYRRNPWRHPESPRVELWCESESIAGVLMPLRDEYAVPIYPLKGQGSETFVYSAASSYYSDRSVVVLYAGDYDPAGLQIAEQLEGKLREYSGPDVPIDFRRIAISDDQARALQALGTPAKQTHWVDYAGVRHDFPGQAIEAEAIEPTRLRNLFSTAIEQIAHDAHGRDIFAESRVVEATERERLDELAREWSA